MTLTLTSCERTDSAPRASRDEFIAALPRVPRPERWFANFSGANLRTVQRWMDGSQDIPPWVLTLLRLRARLEEGISWSMEHAGSWSEGEVAWQNEAQFALWVARARHHVDHIDGNPRNNDPANLRVVTS